MRILLSGKTGQVGYELERSLQGIGEVIALDRHQMDLSNLDQVRTVIRSIKPDLIINPAAYTAVDKAETEPELAMLINGIAPGVMAEEAKKIGAAMIHYSTDYVFDGTKITPYMEDDVPCPINVYGKTKLAGEQAVQATGIPYLILRTSWVYGMRGKNFLLTMLRLAEEREKLSVVSDQHGAPTWSRTIAALSGHIVVNALTAADKEKWWESKSGIYHMTARGETTWYEFAKTLLEHSSLSKTPEIIPIPEKDYPLPAARPKYSVLSQEKIIDKLCTPPNWKKALELCLK